MSRGPMLFQTDLLNPEAPPPPNPPCEVWRCQFRSCCTWAAQAGAKENYERGHLTTPADCHIFPRMAKLFRDQVGAELPTDLDTFDEAIGWASQGKGKPAPDALDWPPCPRCGLAEYHELAECEARSQEARDTAAARRREVLDERRDALKAEAPGREPAGDGEAREPLPTPTESPEIPSSDAAPEPPASAESVSRETIIASSEEVVVVTAQPGDAQIELGPIADPYAPDADNAIDGEPAGEARTEQNADKWANERRLMDDLSEGLL